MGNGLGLSICQNILKCLNGKITVDSKLGGGSTFTIVLNTVRKSQIQHEEQKNKEGQSNDQEQQSKPKLGGIFKKSKHQEKIKSLLPTIDENIVEENNPSIQNNEKLNQPETKKLPLFNISFALPSNASTISSVKTIIAADDQVINIEVLRNQLQELNLADKTEFCVNGQEAIDIARYFVE